MTKIIALLDASNYSTSVCDHAAWMAKRKGASVDLMHVLSRRGEHPADLSGAITLGARSALLSQLAKIDEDRAKVSQALGREVLDEGRARLIEDGVSEVTAKLRIGDLVEEVTSAEEAEDADWLVVGKRGESADFAKLHLGSNLERVVRASTKPVLVASREFKEIKKFVLAFDGGDSAQRALEHICQSKLFAGLEARIVSVGGSEAQNSGFLDTARAKLEAAGYSVETALLSGQPEDAIAEDAQANNVDLVIMGAYGHSRVRSLIIGSTTTAMIRSCHLPIALFR